MKHFMVNGETTTILPDGGFAFLEIANKIATLQKFLVNKAIVA
jgi:hypothetical protein